VTYDTKGLFGKFDGTCQIKLTKPQELKKPAEKKDEKAKK
jgi:hypothetical protein